MKCSTSLIELKNAIKRELADEGSAAVKYADMAAKFTHLDERNFADVLRLMSGHELLHKQILSNIVDKIEFECEGR